MTTDGYRYDAALLHQLGNTQPKFKKISQTGSGDLVALVASNKIKLVGYVLTSDADTTIKLQSKESATDLTGTLIILANKGLGDGVNFPSWLMETLAGETLRLVASNAAANLAGYLRYFLDTVI